MKKTKLQKEAMIKALENSIGIVSAACGKVGISRQTHYRWLEEDEDYADNVKEIKNFALDFAESKLLECIKNNKETSIIFYLKTQGKRRGYIERQEIDTGDNNKFRIEVFDFANEENKNEHSLESLRKQFEEDSN